jgi:hypothetical protein
MLHHHGLSPPRRGVRQSYRRHEWSRPGALLHVDMAELPRFRKPGHAVYRRPHQDTLGEGPRARPGLPAPRRRRPQPLCLRRAAPGPGCRDRGGRARARDRGGRARARDRPPARARPGTARGGDDRQRPRLHPLARVRRRAARQRRAPHRDPALRPTLERQSRTLHPHPQSRVVKRARLAQLTRTLTSTAIPYYNRHRPHSSLDDRPPISRVHNLRGQDSYPPTTSASELSTA